MRDSKHVVLNRLLLTAIAVGAAQSVFAQTSAESLVAWPVFRDVERVSPGEGPWADFVLPPAVFGKARYDLADLRLYDSAGREVSYALRERREEHRDDAIEAAAFNRAEGPEGSQELSLDLGAAQMEHNEVEVQLPGNNFRRQAELEGSPDGESWRRLTAENLIRFERGEAKLADLRLSYPASRFRYLRLRVHRDPLVDEDPVEVGAVTVHRTVAVPGEDLVLPAPLGPREPTRERGAPASAWIISLGSDNVPCDRLEVETPEADFVRNYVIEAAGPPGTQDEFRHVDSGVWQRRAGEKPETLVARFTEVRASRLRLIVIDYRNPALEITAARFAAPARQVVFARPEQDMDLRFYYGNPDAESPNYDFARNLPALLDPAPARADLGEERPNPAYRPKPLPLTERWPWLIYAVLGAASLVLGGVIVSVGSKAIAVHDAENVNA